MSAQALSIAPSQYFKGNDGNWSTFVVNIDDQQLHTLPATSQSSTWVVLSEGCGTSPLGVATCTDLRGGIFSPNLNYKIQTPPGSNEPYFYLPFDSEQALPGYNNTPGEVGFDSLSLAWHGSSQPAQSVANQLIAGYAAPVPWIGILGINYIDNHPLGPSIGTPSLLQTLKNQSNIPSRYVGYTAGASYKETPAFGSLTLGGYDAARVNISNALTVPMQGTSNDLSVYINNIIINTGSSPTIATGFGNSLALIDSTVPEIWLPTEICQQFESALGLVWNTTFSMYFINDTQHDRLVSMNPNFTFTLAQDSSHPQTTTTVTLPYAAFDLRASFPLAGIQDGSSVRYFPLKRAVDKQNLFLGRTFLQEAYIGTNYDNFTLTVGQALFPAQQTLTNVVSVAGPSSPSSSSLTGGAIAGIVVGALAAVALVAGLAFWWWRRRRQHFKKQWEIERSEREKSSRLRGSSFGGDGETTQVGSDVGERVTEWYKGTPGPQSPPAAEEDPYLKPELDATPAMGFNYFRASPRHELDANAERRPSPHRSQQSWGSGGSGVSPMPSEGRVTSMQIGSEHSGEGPLTGGSSPPMLGVGHSRQLSSDSQMSPVYEMGETEHAPREVNADPAAEASHHIASSRGLGVSGVGGHAAQTDADAEAPPQLSSHAAADAPATTTTTASNDLVSPEPHSASTVVPSSAHTLVSPEMHPATVHSPAHDVISPETPAPPRPESEVTIPKPQPGFF